MDHLNMVKLRSIFATLTLAQGEFGNEMEAIMDPFVSLYCRHHVRPHKWIDENASLLIPVIAGLKFYGT